MLKVVSIGGFGHSVFVFDEMTGMDRAQLVGLAPAYAGEDISFFTNHPLCQGVSQYDDFRTMLETVKPDVAVISTRLDLIPELIIEAAEAGCHIIAEKPLAPDLESLKRVEEAVKRTGVRLTAMLSMRNEPEFVAARGEFLKGAIGEPVVVNARKSYKYGVRPDWFGDSRYYSGTLNWVGIHAFDIINYVTGQDFGELTARVGNFSHKELAACEDHCVVNGELSNGGHFSISVDLFRPESAITHGDDWVRVVGTKGILEARGSDNTCMLLTDGETPVSIELPPRGLMFRDFLESLLGEDRETYDEQSFTLCEACIRATATAK
jgi:predicted dehydrogenase